MGINGLLPYLKPIQKDRNISHYANQTVAIDSYCWLHKAIYSCALEVATGIPTDKYITYCLRKIEVLLHYKIRPVVIFDGGALPSKQKTENDRENSRAENRKKAEEYLQAGNTHMAQRKFGESIDVTPQLAFNLYKALRDRYKIECIVGPYEADAQLAYLSRIGYVDVIITEDSDLLAFGAKKVFYKMDANGNGKEIEVDEIKTVRGDVSPDIWSHNIFLSACILAGCDYLNSIRGIGFKKAYKMMGDMRNYKSVIKHLKLEGKHIVPIDYEEKFEKAFLTFRYQRVFCPIKKRLVTLNELDFDNIPAKKKINTDSFLDAVPDVDAIVEENIFSRLLEEGETFDFIGPDKSVELAQNIAYGVIDPITNKPYLPEYNSNTISPPLSWKSEGQETALIPNLSRKAAIQDGGQLEEEFSIRKHALSQFNPDTKTKFYKIAKPKLVGLKGKEIPKPKDQKDIKQFFKGITKGADGNAGKIRDFFKNNKRGTQTSEDLEETLAPSECPDEELELDANDETAVSEQIPEDPNKENEGIKKPMIDPILRRQDSMTRDPILSFLSDSNSEFTYKNSKNLKRAFKAPSQVRRQGSTDSIETEPAPPVQDDKTLKRKFDEIVLPAFNEFAFKKIKKDVKPDTKETIKIPAMLPQRDVTRGVALGSLKELESFAYPTAKKTERNYEDENKKTIYKISLSTFAPKNQIQIDMDSLYKEGEREGTSFFQLNPIVKVQLKERFSNRNISTSYIGESVLENRISSLVSNFY